MTQAGSTVSLTKAIGLIGLVFFCGFATGLLAYHLFWGQSDHQNTTFRIDATLENLSTELALSPRQVEQVREVLDDVIMEEAELLSELKWNQVEARERITRYLTPEQNQQFNEMMKVAFESQ